MSKSVILGLSAVTVAAFSGNTDGASALQSTNGRSLLAAEGGKCWWWCEQGSCEWSWRGCQCVCQSNYEGACCDQQSTCGPSLDACPQDMITQNTVEIDDLLDDTGKFRSDVGPRVNKEGPASLQGVFWLGNQGDSSALLTFAGSYDGGNMGQGGLQEGEYATSIRVAGDRTWAFADDPTLGGNFETVGILDLVYHFRLLEGTLEDPQSFNIIPESRNAGLDLSGDLGEYLLDFSAFKLTEAEAEAKGYPGSVVWDRRSWVAGNEVTSQRYDLVQVVDGEGNPIKPAYDKFVEYQNSAAAGETPGTLFYREALDNDGTLE